jgi:cysteine desulfurase/selenocysteine lyase
MKTKEMERSLDIEAIRKEFPILETIVNGYDLAYLDNAASAQKPLSVLEAISTYYKTSHSNVHRGVHHLSQIATDQFEKARRELAKYFNAKSEREIIFTKGCTDGINLVAYCVSQFLLKKGDEILITEMEHHSNIVPWQMACERAGAKLKVARVDENGVLDLDDLNSKLSEKTKLVSVVHISNALGTINPVEDIIAAAHKVGALVLVDGAQSAPHMQVDVQKMNCDFYVCSGHKMYGPTGSGILFGKEEVLNELPPYQGGGEMIETVTFEKTTYNTLPFKFEAGTPDIASAIGLNAAVDFMLETGVENIAAQEDKLVKLATNKLEKIDGLRIIGRAPNKASVVSFVVDGTHPSDIGAILDKLGVAVRTGHHCTQPLMAKYNLPGTVRASFAVYNTEEEVERLAQGVERAVKMLR